MNLEVPIPHVHQIVIDIYFWKKRNVSKKVIDQTEAVLFLQSKVINIMNTMKHIKQLI